ncbi:MAG: hypothetical protein ACRD3W_00585, partial [Terriglobales bacterium]
NVHERMTLLKELCPQLNSKHSKNAKQVCLLYYSVAKSDPSIDKSIVFDATFQLARYYYLNHYYKKALPLYDECVAISKVTAIPREMLGAVERCRKEIQAELGDQK